MICNWQQMWMTAVYRDLAMVYTNENWFVILLSRVYFRDLVTEIHYFSLLNSNNSAQLRTLLVMYIFYLRTLFAMCVFSNLRINFIWTKVFKTLSGSMCNCSWDGSCPTGGLCNLPLQGPHTMGERSKSWP